MAMQQLYRQQNLTLYCSEDRLELIMIMIAQDDNVLILLSSLFRLIVIDKVILTVVYFTVISKIFQHTFHLSLFALVRPAQRQLVRA
jgi:hypothetical protein